MSTISFDYDGTLSRKGVQEFAGEMIDAGHKVIIVTNRANDKTNHNKDLFEVAKNLGIPKNNINFCEGLGKVRFMHPFLKIDVHLDDDWVDCEDIYLVHGIETVNVSGNPGWKEEVLLKLKSK
jgi:hypothetical protein